MSKAGDQHPTPLSVPPLGGKPSAALHAAAAAAAPPPQQPPLPPKGTAPVAPRPSWVVAADPALGGRGPTRAAPGGRRRVMVAVSAGLLGSVAVAGGLAWVFLRPPDAMDLYLTAKAHMEKGEPTQALALIERGRHGASDPRVVALLTQLEREIALTPRLKIAEQLIASRQLTAAEQVLREALSVDPGSDRARAQLETVRATIAEEAQAAERRRAVAAPARPSSDRVPAPPTPAAPAAGRGRRAAAGRGRGGRADRPEPRAPVAAPAASVSEAPVQPPPGTVPVRIRASDAATLVVDGQATGKTTPATVYLAPGMHRVEARSVADPNLKSERRIMVAADAPAAVELQLPARAPTRRAIETVNPYGEEK